MKRVAALLLLVTSTAAGDALHHLQDNCAKLASKTFRRELRTNTGSTTGRISTSICANASMKKPTSLLREGALISGSTCPISKTIESTGGFHISTTMGLIYCSLQDKECHSEAEWNELLEPYMKE
jgi:hypothetical protein